MRIVFVMVLCFQGASSHLLAMQRESMEGGRALSWPYHSAYLRSY